MVFFGFFTLGESGLEKVHAVIAQKREGRGGTGGPRRPVEARFGDHRTPQARRIARGFSARPQRLQRGDATALLLPEFRPLALMDANRRTTSRRRTIRPTSAAGG